MKITQEVCWACGALMSLDRPVETDRPMDYLVLHIGARADGIRSLIRGAGFSCGATTVLGSGASSNLKAWACSSHGDTHRLARKGR